MSRMPWQGHAVGRNHVAHGRLEAYVAQKNDDTQSRQDVDRLHIRALRFLIVPRPKL